MITEAELYWITRLDNIRTFFLICSCLGGIIFICSLPVYVVNLLDDYEDICKTSRKLISTALAVLIILGIGLILTPTTKEMAAIKVIPMIVNSDTTLKLKDSLNESTSNLIDLTNSYIKNKLDVNKDIIIKN